VKRGKGGPKEDEDVSLPTQKFKQNAAGGKRKGRGLTKNGFENTEWGNCATTGKGLSRGGSLFDGLTFGGRGEIPRRGWRIAEKKGAIGGGRCNKGNEKPAGVDGLSLSRGGNEKNGCAGGATYTFNDYKARGFPNREG